MKISPIPSLFCGAFFIFLILSCSSKKTGKQDPVSKEIPAIPVNAVVINTQELDNKIQIVGTILPNEKVELKSEMAGRITGIFFQEGTLVSKGQLLVKINDQELQAQMKKVKLQLDLAIREEERKKKLLEIGGITQEDFDIASNQTKTLNADADLLAAQIRKTEIIAPFQGTIGLRAVSEGEIVSPSTLIASLQQIDPIKVEFDIPEKYGSFLKRGSTINFTVTGSEKIYKGSVYASEPMVDLSTRTLKVRARSSNEDMMLKPGSFIKIDLFFEKNKNAMVVPTEAVIASPKGLKVFTAKNGMAFSRTVKTGARSESTVQIIEGLTINDTVITSGIMQLKDSSRVRIKLVK
jgi:membrane fusion protein (multidrug efflux system)